MTDMGVLTFFILNLCAAQNFDGQGCAALSTAYFVSVNGQKTLDEANHKYLDPQPEDVKKILAFGLMVSQQHIHIGLNRYLTIDSSIHRDVNFNTVSENRLIFHMEFE